MHDIKRYETPRKLLKNNWWFVVRLLGISCKTIIDLQSSVHSLQLSANCCYLMTEDRKCLGLLCIMLSEVCSDSL